MRVAVGACLHRLPGLDAFADRERVLTAVRLDQAHVPTHEDRLACRPEGHRGKSQQQEDCATQFARNEPEPGNSDHPLNPVSSRRIWRAISANLAALLE